MVRVDQYGCKECKKYTKQLEELLKSEKEKLLEGINEEFYNWFDNSEELIEDWWAKLREKLKEEIRK